MLEKFKETLYFPVASYFRFFARIRLRRWNPQILVVTGSSGKTTLLHLLESQFGEKAYISHHANSSFGIPFDILNLHRKTLLPSEWIGLILSTPFALLRPVPKQKIYIVEADCDRPGEGEFLAKLLQPEIVLWINSGKTHSMNFDSLVSQGKFASAEEAIAYEYGYFLQYCQKLAIVNADSSQIMQQVKRTKAEVRLIKKSEILKNYILHKSGTKFELKKDTFSLDGLLPEEVFFALAMCKESVEFLKLPFDRTFKHFYLPPGRGSLFSGIKNTTLIDSTYNSNLLSLKAMLKMFKKFDAGKKWVVIGDMLELGKEEKREHEELAEELTKMHLDKIILIGKRVSTYTRPKIKNHRHVVAFETLSETLKFLEENIEGGETILFKGSQSLMLEVLIEQLLADKKDAIKLPRQELFWQKKRREAMI